MTIQITAPEVEALIQQRLAGGGFKNAEDVILHALRSSSQRSKEIRPRKSLREVFESVQGLADDLDFTRNLSEGRPADLS